MTQSSLGQIDVMVNSPDEEGQKLVSNICARALNDSGFNNVQIYNKRLDPVEPYEGETVVSLLDTLKQSNPRLFSTPVRVMELSSFAAEVTPVGVDIESVETFNKGVRTYATEAAEGLIDEGGNDAMVTEASGDDDDENDGLDNGAVNSPPTDYIDPALEELADETQ